MVNLSPGLATVIGQPAVNAPTKPSALSSTDLDLLTGSIVGNLTQWILIDLPYTAEDMAPMVHWMSTYGVLLARDEHDELRQVIREYVNKS